MSIENQPHRIVSILSSLDCEWNRNEIIQLQIILIIIYIIRGLIQCSIKMLDAFEWQRLFVSHFKLCER